MTTALQRALSGQTVSEGGLKKALLQASTKIENANKKAAKVKGQAKAMGGACVTTVEIQGATALSSLGAGYFSGNQKATRITRGVIGTGALLYGISEAGDGGGDHALAIGNGVLASVTAEMAYQAGYELKQAREKKEVAPPAGKVDGSLHGSESRGAIRDIPLEMTDAPSMQGSRFIRARAL